MITGILTMSDVEHHGQPGGTVKAGLEDGATIFKIDVVDGYDRRTVVWLDRGAVIKLIAAGATALLDM